MGTIIRSVTCIRLISRSRIITFSSDRGSRKRERKESRRSFKRQTFEIFTASALIIFHSQRRRFLPRWLHFNDFQSFHHRLLAPTESLLRMLKYEYSLWVMNFQDFRSTKTFEAFISSKKMFVNLFVQTYDLMRSIQSTSCRINGLKNLVLIN